MRSWSVVVVVAVAVLTAGCEESAADAGAGRTAGPANTDTSAVVPSAETAPSRPRRTGGPLSVRVFGPASIAGQVFPVPHGQRWECIIPLLAETDGGSEGDYAEWRTVSIKFYNLQSGAFAGGSTVTQRDVEIGWGSNRIYAGQTQNSPTPFSHEFPFRVDFAFEYVPFQGEPPRSAGETKTANYSVRCESPETTGAVRPNRI